MGEATTTSRPFSGSGGRSQVPGSVHLDLYRAGVIADPFARSTRRLAWVDEADLTTVALSNGKPSRAPRRVLRFEASTTICAIYLNGSRVAAHDNMFVPSKSIVTDSLVAGENHLEVQFSSAVR